MNQARRFLRERAEAGSRSQDTEQRKALGKLVYVSYLVFGAQQAAFLMPLRRVFSIQPASIDVMRRDNAKQLFDNYIKAHGGELQVGCVSIHAPHAIMHTTQYVQSFVVPCVRSLLGTLGNCNARQLHVYTKLQRHTCTAQDVFYSGFALLVLHDCCLPYT